MTIAEDHRRYRRITEALAELEEIGGLEAVARCSTATLLELAASPGRLSRGEDRAAQDTVEGRRPVPAL